VASLSKHATVLFDKGVARVKVYKDTNTVVEPIDHFVELAEILDCGASISRSLQWLEVLGNGTPSQFRELATSRHASQTLAGCSAQTLERLPFRMTADGSRTSQVLKYTTATNFGGRLVDKDLSRCGLRRMAREGIEPPTRGFSGR
jgi:hypothetical protein